MAHKALCDFTPNYLFKLYSRVFVLAVISSPWNVLLSDLDMQPPCYSDLFKRDFQEDFLDYPFSITLPYFNLPALNLAIDICLLVYCPFAPLAVLVTVVFLAFRIVLSIE